MKKISSLVCFMLFVHISSIFANDNIPMQSAIVNKVEFVNECPLIELNEVFLFNNIQVKTGDKFKPFLTDSSIKSLYSSNQFDYIEVEVEQIEDNKCNIVFYVTPKPKVESLSFEGNKKFKNKRLCQEIKTKEFMPFNEAEFKLDALKLENFYSDKGFPKVNIIAKSEFNKGTHSVSARFVINEGAKTYIRKIKFNGVADVPRKELNNAIRTKIRSFWSWLNGTGIYRQLLIEEDVEAVRDTMKNHGYLDAQVSADNVAIDYYKTGSMNVIINIESGEKYYVGNINIQGNTIFSEEKIRSLIRINSNDIFSPKLFEDLCDGIKDLYGKLGYLDAFVQIIKEKNANTRKVDVILNVIEGDKFTVKNIAIKGNHKTKNKVILRELALAPGDQFDLVRMRNSQARLRNTGFFATVDVSPEDTDEARTKNLKIDVTEAKTGKVSLGGGISTGATVMGYLELSQSNFDLFGKKSKFQGSGQKFRARINSGKHNVGFNVNFEEPWFYDREIAVGANLFMNKTEYSKHDHDYSGASYDDKRIGGEIYLRKRLFELWVGTVTYELQNVNISDIGENAPHSIKKEKGNTSISRGKFNLTRDTRDNFIYPRLGFVISTDAELAGGPFFGETKFYKLECSAAKFFPTFDELEQVIMFRAKIGTVSSFGNNTVPFFEKYKLGGADHMRGFKGGDISTKEEGTSVGGNSYGYSCAEYTFKLAEPLRFHTFLEAGFVHEKKFQLGLNDLYSDCGFGVKIFIMGAPLRLDFGWPLHVPRGHDYQKHGMRFNYSFGLNF